MALYNLARVTTATTGTGTITLGAAVSGFLLFGDAGVPDGATVTYAVRDGSNSEIGRGVYTASGATLTRATILESTNAGAPISLSGAAEVFITAAAEDLQALENRPLLFNLLEDGGRFAGSPEPSDTIAPAYTVPSYLFAYNGATFSAGHQFIFDNNDYGGTRGALGSDARSLIDKVKSSGVRRYGPEWYIMNIAAGTSTNAPSVVAGGVTHYLCATNSGVPLPARYTLNYYVRCISGSVAIGTVAALTRYRDGVLVTGDFRIVPADNWVQVTLVHSASPSDFTQYSFVAFYPCAAPSSQVRLALPTLFPGHYDVAQFGQIGCVSGVRGWR